MDLNEIFKKHLTNIGIKPEELTAIFEAETLEEEQAKKVNEILSSTMTRQVAITDRNVRNAVIKDVMTGAENSILDYAVANKIVDEKFIEELSSEPKLSGKVKKIFDHVGSSKPGTGKAKELAAQVEDLKKQLESGEGATNTRVTKLSETIETLKKQLEEKDNAIGEQKKKFSDYQLNSFFNKQLDKIPLKDNGDATYRTFLRNQIIQEARARAAWVMNEEGTDANPRQLDDINLPIFGEDQVNAHSATTFLQTIAVPYIKKNGSGDGGEGEGGGRGGQSPKYQGSGGNGDGLTDEQRRRLKEAQRRQKV